MEIRDYRHIAAITVTAYASITAAHTATQNSHMYKTFPIFSDGLGFWAFNQGDKPPGATLFFWYNSQVWAVEIRRELDADPPPTY